MDPSEYTDSGLGWIALSDWMIYNDDVLLATLSSLSWDNTVTPDPGNIPVTSASAADIVSSGQHVFDNTRYNWPFYVGADNPSCLIFAVVNQFGQPNNYVIVSTTYNATVYMCRADVGVVTNTFHCTLNVPNSSLYYAQLGEGSGSQIGNIDIPTFSTKEDAWTHLTSAGAEIRKVNEGYAVGALASWKTQNGTIISTPVLLSSESDYTDMTIDSSAYNLAKLNILHQGMRFYMSFFDIVGPVGYASLLNVFDKTAPDDGYLTLEQVFGLISSGYYASINVYNAPDPYEQETEQSEEDGGDGEDPDDDPVDEETLPLPAVVGLGFSTIYVPTQSDLFNLAAYLWGGNLDLTNFLKLFANPMDSILGLSAVPLVLSGTYEPIYLGGQQLQGITLPRYTGRTAVKVDMGTATISKRWGSYLDYDPYTELAIYVPFVGIKNIKADDVMDKTIRLMYDIDILSGACIAYIRPEGGSPLYEWSGQCAMQIPITGANWDNIFNSAIHTVATLGGALFAPASAPVLGGAVASAASQAIAAKPRIERSGAVNGVTGFLGQLRPYIIRTIPEAYIPNDQNKFIGYPSYVSVNLGDLKGYNEIASIHLENIPATGDELTELESILKGGAIF